MVLAAALPVLPGQEDRVTNFESELQPHRAEWERLNGEATITLYSTSLQEMPDGAVAIHVMVADDPNLIGREFTDSDYDNWWLDYLRDVHGVDLRGVPLVEQPKGATTVFEWRG